MTASACFRRRACGGRSAPSASATSSILDGGLPKWIAEGRPLAEGETVPQPRHFTAAPRPRPGRLAATTCGGERAGRRDRRPADRRRALGRALSRRGGGAPPRPALRPYSGRAQSPLEAMLVRRPAEAARRSSRPLSRRPASILRARSSTTCGSGVTASILRLALAASAATPRRSMTAPGRNGALRPICRSRTAGVSRPGHSSDENCARAVLSGRANRSAYFAAANPWIRLIAQNVRAGRLLARSERERYDALRRREFGAMRTPERAASKPRSESRPRHEKSRSDHQAVQARRGEGGPAGSRACTASPSPRPRASVARRAIPSSIAAPNMSSISCPR